MSELMLSDENTINDINPFTTGQMSVPGTVRQVGDFANFTDEIRDEGYGVADPEPSPGCAVAARAGYRTADYCFPKDKNCPLERPLHPKRNIDYGFTRREKAECEQRVSPSPRRFITGAVVRNNKGKLSIIIILILILLIL